MPRGGRGGHKGQRRHFTSFEELEQQRKREEREREWRKQKGDSESEEESASEEESSEEEEQKKPKGAASLIEVENPNRVVQKNKKAATLTLEEGTEKTELSRRDKEEIQKQRAQAHYQKLHAEGKTDEARADMARLAIIRKQREEAAQKREEERKTKEALAKAKRDATHKALGKNKS